MDNKRFYECNIRISITALLIIIASSYTFGWIGCLITRLIFG